MEKWQNFFLQRMGTDSYSIPYPVFESVSQWGIWCKDIPFRVFGKVKEPAKRQWPDEHGDDEYISSDGLYLEAYEMKVEFACKKTESLTDVRVAVGNFLEYLRSAGMMKLYSSYTRIGRQNVRLSSVDDNAKWKVQDGVEYLIFSVTFKVNDPKTDVILTTPSSSSSSSSNE